MQPTTFTDNDVCFMFSGKREQQPKPSTTMTTTMTLTFSTLKPFDKMITNSDLPLKTSSNN